jgi:hypothetical protein
MVGIEFATDRPRKEHTDGSRERAQTGIQTEKQQEPHHERSGERSADGEPVRWNPGVDDARKRRPPLGIREIE